MCGSSLSGSSDTYLETEGQFRPHTYLRAFPTFAEQHKSEATTQRSRLPPSRAPTRCPG